MHKIFGPGIKMRNGRFILPKNRSTGQVVADLAEMRHCADAGTLVEEMVSTSDTHEFFSVGINTFFAQENDDDDRQYEQLFRVVPSTKSGELFPLRDPTAAGGGSHGIVFKEVGELGEIVMSTVVSDEKFVKNVKYATAIGYSNEWMEDGDLALVEMVTEDFRQAAFDKLAEIHYGIFPAGVTAGVIKTSPVASATLDGFISSINAAVAIMRRDRFSPDFIVGAPEQEDIILQAMHDVYRDRTLTESARRMRVIITDYLAAGTAFLVRAQRRLVSTDRLALTLGNFQDLLHDSETLVGKFRRGVALLDGNSVRGITGL